MGVSRLIVWGVCILMIWSIISCNGEPAKEISPDVSDIKINNKWVRIDQKLAQIDTNNVEVEIEALEKEYPAFFKIFFHNILPFKKGTKEEFVNMLYGYLTDPQIRQLQDTTEMIFSNFETEVVPQVDDAMKRMQYYIAGFNPPNFYTFTSEFTYQQFIFSDKSGDALGIGLDMFLGSNYPYKRVDPNNVAFSKYLTRCFNKEHLPRKVVQILVDDILDRPSGTRMLDQMIHNGKNLYIMEKVLPNIPDSLLHEYTAAQTQWVEDNELQMWAFFFEEDMFYESNSMKINKYLNPSPNSPGMPDAAPGRTANYIGWKIVKAYMDRNKDQSIIDLINEKDNQKIMDESRYKPKQKK